MINAMVFLGYESRRRLKSSKQEPKPFACSTEHLLLLMVSSHQVFPLQRLAANLGTLGPLNFHDIFAGMS